MVSSDVSPGKRYMCFVDICTEGVQFCDLPDQRCRYCSDFAKHCFTNLQQLNCTRYCMEKWTETQQNTCTFDKEKGEFLPATIIVIITQVIALSICLVYIIDNELLAGKIRQYIVKMICFCKYNKKEANISDSLDTRYRPVTSIEDDRQEGEGREGENDVVQSTRIRGGLRDGDQSGNGLHSSNPSTRLAPYVFSTPVSVYQSNGHDFNVTTLQNDVTENRDRNERCGGNGVQARHVSGVEHTEDSPPGCRVTGELEFDSSRNGPPAISYHSDNINPQRDTGYETGTTNHSQTHLKTRPTIGQNQGDSPRGSNRFHPRDGQTSELADMHSKRNGTAAPEQNWQTLSSLTSVNSSKVRSAFSK